MSELLVGSWISDSSNIPGYVPGREWLHFTMEGVHVMEALHPGQNMISIKTMFTMQCEEGAYRFQPTKKLQEGSAQKSWRVSIVPRSLDEIEVTPDLPKHGFTTVFRRVIKPESNQPVQHNADSRPSSGDSPLSETPSLLGPRG